jgi:hypothetical protein
VAKHLKQWSNRQNLDKTIYAQIIQYWLWLVASALESVGATSAGLVKSSMRHEGF